MKVFIAGGSGVLGQRLVPLLIARGHEVTATTTSKAKLELLRKLGAKPVVMDGQDAASVREAVTGAEPDVLVHQMTALGVVHAGTNMKSERYFAGTVKLRTQGTDNLLAAAEAAGVSHIVAQSNAAANGPRDGGWDGPERDPLDLSSGFGPLVAMEPVRYLEEAVLKAGGAALRYGWFYGPGATDDQVEMLRKRKFPQIGNGAGVWSWIHLDDAADATLKAIEQKAHGIYNIVDDDPAEVREWLPYLASCAGAKKPMRIPAWLGGLLAGEVAVTMMTKAKGSSNAKAKAELGWEPAHPSWRQGFKDVLA
ncbi:NAD-dependent epimerase/dehydratase family protein [Actinomadura rupiterrae]|uniref:NAD-dependent epimerase/dehydratase family protein n=1 Tax=Actinomadura rupiterrae TaxID=559627 RepID=UPI0020A5F9C0|nr:NAD(P)-dependent oxidoreductase [Actinomadura rupiterrae]MCP2340704.1 nucleoside-diphosphate-sugar epimerase [Actinomadura rupiterrae]